MKTLTDNTITDAEEAYKQIPGWGVDANPENDPTYPMKKYTGDDHKRIHYTRPPRQAKTVEILHSTERPNVTAVFGTSSPPSGLSGMLRRFAFRYSEGKWAHWLTLILADRVNMVEGIFSDVKKGYFPNIFKERGWNAEWKYNRKGYIKKTTASVAVATAAALLTLYLIRRSRQHNS
jgi:hypothetical protein